MAKLGFTKMHGCGNDYIYVIADRVRPADPAALSRRLSDRRFGIGGDGLIMLAPSKSADVRMEMYNADGSRGEMCGNGIRCVARLHYERAARPRNPQNQIVVETDCGLKSVALKLDGGRVSEATVDMGEPILEGREIPVAADGRVVDYPLEVGGRTWRITAVSMGNPHCVVFVDDEAVFALEDSEFARVGRQFEHHSVLSPPRQHRVHPAAFTRSAADARVGARLGRDAGLRHGGLRLAGRGGADRAGRAARDAGVARRKAGNRMA